MLRNANEILKIGLPLHDYGVNNWALTKEQALSALDKFMTAQISILGGDVFEKINDLYKPNYDNWYCDKKDGENKREYLERSIITAKNYIKDYKTKEFSNNFFVIVPEVE